MAIEFPVLGKQGVADTIVVSKGKRSIQLDAGVYRQTLELSYSFNGNPLTLLTKRKLQAIEIAALDLLRENSYQGEEGYQTFTDDINTVLKDINDPSYPLSKRETYLLASLLDEKNGPAQRGWGTIRFDAEEDGDEALQPRDWATRLGLPTLNIKPNPGDKIFFFKDANLIGWNCVINGDKQATETDGDADWQEGVTVKAAAGSRFSNISWDLTDFYDRVICGSKPMTSKDPLPSGIRVEGDFRIKMHNGPNLFWTANAGDLRHENDSTLHLFAGVFSVDIGGGKRGEVWNPPLKAGPKNLKELSTKERYAAFEVYDDLKEAGALWGQEGYFDYAQGLRDKGFPMHLVRVYRIANLIMKEREGPSWGPHDWAWGNMLSAQSVEETKTFKGLLEKYPYRGAGMSGKVRALLHMQELEFFLEGGGLRQAHTLAFQLLQDHGPSERRWGKMFNNKSNTMNLGASRLRGGRIFGSGQYDWVRLNGENLNVYGRLHLGPWEGFRGAAFLTLQGDFPWVGEPIKDEESGEFLRDPETGALQLTGEIYLQNRYFKTTSLVPVFLIDLLDSDPVRLEVEEADGFHQIDKKPGLKTLQEEEAQKEFQQELQEKEQQ